MLASMFRRVREKQLAIGCLALIGAGCSPMGSRASGVVRSSASANMVTAQARVEVVHETACEGEDRHPARGSVEAGPARIDPDDTPDRVRVESLSLGNAGQGGIEHERYAIELLAGATGAPSRIYQGEVAGEGGATVQLVDLDGDGRSEILVRESWNWMTCDLTGTALVSRWLLLTDQGRVLFETQARERSWTKGYATLGFEETATVVRLHNGAAALALRGGGRLRIVATVANRATAAAEVSCEMLDRPRL